MADLPLFFVILAAAALGGALLGLWVAVRAMLDPTAGAVEAGRGPAGERATLLDEKAALLRNMKDLEFEQAVGKISDKDFAEQDNLFRGRAREVLRELDTDLAPYMARAESLIKSRVSAGATTPPVDAPAASSHVTRCAPCGTTNDADAVFCKKCGARLSGAASADDPGATS